MVYFVLKNNKNIGADRKEIDILKMDSQAYFGTKTSESNNEILSFKLDNMGEGAFLFNTDSFNAIDFPSLKYSIKNLPKNFRPYIIWKVKGDSEIYEMSLIQPTGEIQNVLINRNEDWRGEVILIGLSFASQEHLGLSIPYVDEIVVNTFQLGQYSYFSDYFTLFNYWVEYVPWSYQSINHLRVNQLLPIYAHSTVFASVWFFICWLALVVRKNKRNSIFILIVTVWLFLSLLHLKNMSGITQWSNDVYAKGENVLADEQLLEIAKSVKSILQLDHENLQKIKKTKVLILSTDKYQRSRVIYHMLPINSSFIDVNLEKGTESRVIKDDYILSLSLTLNPIRPSAGLLKYNEHVIKVREVASEDSFSLMEVLQ